MNEQDLARVLSDCALADDLRHSERRRVVLADRSGESGRRRGRPAGRSDGAVDEDRAGAEISVPSLLFDDQLDAPPAVVTSGWARDVVDCWGLCGVMAQQDQLVVGFLTVAPALLAPQTGRYANAHLSPDVGVLLSCFVDPDHRARGIGRQLVQSAAAELAKRRLTALEAIGRNDADVAEPFGPIPTGFLTAVGFRVVQPHPVAPRLRMDLSTTVRWRPDLAAAWGRLTELVSQPIPPQPAGFKQSRQAEQPTVRST